MKEGTRAFAAPERALPGMPSLLHKFIPAFLAEKQREFLVHIPLQLFRVAFPNLIQDLRQLGVDPFLRFQQHPVEIGKHPKVGHVRKTSRREPLTAPRALSVFHHSPFI
jgi:hypothetical protein